MKILQLFNPVYLIRSIKDVLYDISNYLFFVTQIKKIIADNILFELYPRLDKLNRLYYVLNLDPAILNSGYNYYDLERSRVYESVHSIEDRLSNFNITEIIDIRTNRILTSDYYAYLIILSYKWKTSKLSIASIVFWTSLIITILILLF